MLTLLGSSAKTRNETLIQLKSSSDCTLIPYDQNRFCHTGALQYEQKGCVNAVGYTRWDGRDDSPYSLLPVLLFVHSTMAESTSRDLLCLLWSSCRLQCFCPYVPLNVSLGRELQLRGMQDSTHLFTEQQIASASPTEVSTESQHSPAISHSLGDRYILVQTAFCPMYSLVLRYYLTISVKITDDN